MKPQRGTVEAVTQYAQVDPETGCWLWTARLSVGGYGRFGSRLAHRVAYERIVGPIPEGHELDHLCQVARCINPAHLDPVTPQENQRRRQLSITHCRQGHEYTPENTKVGYRGRICRTCEKALFRRQVEKARARRLALAVAS